MWALIEGDLRQGCGDGTLCVKPVPEFRVLNDDTLDSCGFAYTDPGKDAPVKRDSIIKIVGKAPCPGSGQGSGGQSPGETPDPASPAPDGSTSPTSIP